MQMKIPFGDKKLLDHLHDDDIEVSLIDGWTKRRIAYVVVLITMAVLFVVHFKDIASALGVVYNVLVPFFAGAAVAYLLNLIMSRLESVYFPNSTNIIVVKSRRLACMIASLLIVGIVIASVAMLVSEQLVDSVAALFQGITAAFNAVHEFVTEFGLDTGALAFLGTDLNEWEKVISEAIEQIGGVDKVVSSAFTLTGALTSGVFDGFIAVVFAIYLLLGKERVQAGAKTLGRTVLPTRSFKYVCHVCEVANDCFSRFITGQCLEATILGSLCALGMSIIGIPYAMSIGVLVGMFSLVPLVGAWIGGTVGALMILPISFEQALVFVVFLLILQQIEGNFIYPRVVGGTVGVSGIWVLLAVFAGGALFGIAGVLLGVPFVATASRLLDEVWKREDDPEEPAPPDNPEQPIALAESAEPAAPAEPTAPAEPVAPTDPTEPAEVNPAD